MKHEERKNSPQRELEKQPKHKGKQYECAKEFNKVLTNATKGTNQPQQRNANQEQNTLVNHIRQIGEQTHQTRQALDMRHAQNFSQNGIHQQIQPTNLHRMGQPILPNLQYPLQIQPIQANWQYPLQREMPVTNRRRPI